MSFSYTPDMNRRLKAVRKALKLTQKEMAESLGMTDSNFSQLEREARIMKSTVLHVCSRYNVSYDFLVFGEGPMFIETDRFEAEMVEAFGELTPTFQQLVRDIVMDVRKAQDAQSNSNAASGEEYKGSTG